MPNTRVMLWIAFAAILFLNYEAWMRDYPRVGAGHGTIPDRQCRHLE